METKSYTVPVVAAIAIIVIAGAIYFYQGPDINNGQTAAIVQSLTPLLQPAEDINLDSLRPIDGEDRLWGKTTAPVKLIVYSDLECPACAWFHGQVKELGDYVEEGKIAVAFRHFPLDSIHPDARSLAAATECAGKVGNDEKFWQFIDVIFAAPDKSAENLVANTAQTVGLDAEDFAACQAEEEISQAVEDEYQEAVSLGAQGTPFIVMVGPKDFAMPIFGGREAKNLKQATDLLLVDEETETETETETEEVATTSPEAE